MGGDWGATSCANCAGSGMLNKRVQEKVHDDLEVGHIIRKLHFGKELEKSHWSGEVDYLWSGDGIGIWSINGVEYSWGTVLSKFRLLTWSEENKDMEVRPDIATP